MTVAERITGECEAVKDLLLRKNADYGNSALEPVRIFSRAETSEQIRVRIDDKLARLRNRNTTIQEDTIQDLIGYLILLKIAETPHADTSRT